MRHVDAGHDIMLIHANLPAVEESFSSGEIGLALSLRRPLQYNHRPVRQVFKVRPGRARSILSLAEINLPAAMALHVAESPALQPAYSLMVDGSGGSVNFIVLG